jgi:hypothetical protein
MTLQTRRTAAHRHLVTATIALLALVACVTTTRATAAPDAAFQSAFQQFNSASAGDAAAVDKAADSFDALLKAEPANPVLMAYAGASTAMKAGTTMAPWKKMGYAEDGLAQIDKALAMLTPAHDAPVQHRTPGVLEVKFIAANTFLAVPGFMNRGARGAKLLNEVLASPLFAAAPLPFKGQVWMRAAALATKEQRTIDAKRYLNEVIAQGAPQADAAKAKLAQVPA